MLLMLLGFLFRDLLVTKSFNFRFCDLQGADEQPFKGNPGTFYLVWTIDFLLASVAILQFKISHKGHPSLVSSSEAWGVVMLFHSFRSFIEKGGTVPNEADAPYRRQRLPRRRLPRRRLPRRRLPRRRRRRWCRSEAFRDRRMLRVALLRVWPLGRKQEVSGLCTLWGRPVTPLREFPVLQFLGFFQIPEGNTESNRLRNLGGGNPCLERKLPRFRKGLGMLAMPSAPCPLARGTNYPA